MVHRARTRTTIVLGRSNLHLLHDFHPALLILVFIIVAAAECCRSCGHGWNTRAERLRLLLIRLVVLALAQLGILRHFRQGDAIAEMAAHWRSTQSRCRDERTRSEQAAHRSTQHTGCATSEVDKLQTGCLAADAHNKRGVGREFESEHGTRIHLTIIDVLGLGLNVPNLDDIAVRPSHQASWNVGRHGERRHRVLVGLQAPNRLARRRYVAAIHKAIVAADEEQLGCGRVPQGRFDVGRKVPLIDTLGLTAVKHCCHAVKARRQEDGHLRGVPADSVDLLAVMCVGANAFALGQVPQLDSVVGGAACKEIALGRVPADGKHLLFVAASAIALALLFAFFLLATHVSEDKRRLGSLHDVHVPDFDERRHGADGDEVARRLRARVKVQPLHAQGIA
eukprot:m.105377 g.105377  ORF g.105377 m.105377 type:complete len:395 (+) comp9141_c0_seq1:281-1465(+)